MDFEQAITLLDSIVARVQLDRESHMRVITAVQTVTGERANLLAQVARLKEQLAKLDVVHRDQAVQK